MNIRSMEDMKNKSTTRVLITISKELLKKIDRLAKKAEMDRAAYICASMEAKLFADEMKEANS